MYIHWNTRLTQEVYSRMSMTDIYLYWRTYNVVSPEYMDVLRWKQVDDNTEGKP